jgi:hypothetical protein
MTMSQPDKHASGAMAREPEDDVTRCFACGEALKKGEMVMHDASEAGLIHAACCGPEREAYHGADGEPLKDGEPIPTGWPWPGDDPALSALRSEAQREGLAGRLAELREVCAKVAEQEALDFLSPEYATGQPLSSFAERFACEQVAKEIRALDIGALALHATSQPLSQEGGHAEIERLERDLAEADEWIREATKAITNLTAGGSEYFARRVRGVYRADLPFCVQRIRDRFEGAERRWRDAIRAAAPQPPLPPGAPDALAVLKAIRAELPKTDPGPAFDEYGYKSQGNYGDVASDAAAYAEWLIAEKLDAAIAQAEAGTSGTSFISSLSSEQLERLRSYNGPEDHGSPEANRQGVELTQLERQLLREINGELPASAWGAWVGACSEALRAMSLIDRQGRITEAGKAALAQPQGSGPSERGA